VDVKLAKPGTEGQVLVLDRCPMNPDHGHGTDTAVIVRPGGRVGFECKHNGCADFTWKDVVAKLDPDGAAPVPGIKVPEDSYGADEGGIYRHKPTPDGVVRVPLTNFDARIIADVSHDDGVEVWRMLELEVKLGGRGHRLQVSATQFSSMTWVVEQLGATALLYPGQGTKDHARAAIQVLSKDIAARTVYTHTGWRQIGDRWLFLHAGGALGENGQDTTIETALPSGLELFQLPAPPAGEDLKAAIRASLALLDLAPDRVMLPLFCAIWRAVLGSADLTLHLVGQTGTGKSELAALAQQHFGAGMSARRLPSSWSSTGNALEALAFHAKDVLLVVDDFAPGGTVHDVQRLHREADRFLRAQGNNSGRRRMAADGTLRPVKGTRGPVAARLAHPQWIQRSQPLMIWVQKSIA
jgi:hypothetical protein